MDPLSDLLAVVRPHVVGAGGFDLAGAWSIGFPQHNGVKCYAMARGGGWLALDGVDDPIRLSEGDCFVLSPGAAFRLASDLAKAPVDYSALERRGDVRSWNGGGEHLIVGGHFALESDAARLLTHALPAVVHVQGEADRAAVRWALDRMRDELAADRLGGSFMLRQLTQMLLLQVIRRHIELAAGGGAGFLAALGQPRLRRAIAAIHADPARPWTVEALAREAGASRSSFARLFSERVGQTPMAYVARWRMMLAADRMRAGELPLSAIARSLGYATESGFSAAFRRETGRSPGHYRKGS